MEWYWYVIMASGVLGLGFLKVAVWQKIKEKKRAKAERSHKDED